MTPLADRFLTLPIAHRALHDVTAGRPENSLAAIRAARDSGYGIEIDVQLSRDGCAMVFHDYDLARLTGEQGALGQRSAAELGEILLKGGNEPIPTLAQVVKTVAGRVPLLVEIKDQDGAMGADTGPLEQAVTADLHGYDGELAVMSFNPNAVATMQDLAPAIPRGLITDAYRAQDWPLLPGKTRDRLRAIPDFDAVGASFISHNARDLDRARVGALKARGVPILCWTIRSQVAEDQARQTADNITFEGYTAKIPGT
jgi:glycerophosphoryl diester phosphodiesterase